jgi:diaminohydroxyphosphoribosylaminopyrimidine deaminase / 5-amino-6-(5-phosphoribosylamino)uracil reductase
MNTYMQKCLELAQRAKGHTAPNPMVGAVLVYGERIIGEGWHHFYGADHAEVNCLKNVADADKSLIPQSTMYVNLEPCAHYGITPPCAVRLVKEKVKKVVIANIDPFEKVSGSGLKILTEGGIEVETGILEKEGLWLNRRFFCFHSRNRPYIILKWAQTNNGFIAPSDKSQLWITGKESQKLVHKWRTEEGAIMVGTNTAMCDNPRLTARLHEGKQPLRIVLDRNLQLPPTNHVFDSAAATWIVNEQHEWLNGNVHSVKLKFDDTLLTQLMARLHAAKILSIIIEGGAVLLNSFIGKGLWDEARIFTGDVFLKDGIPAPRLENEVPVFHKESGADSLQVFTNKNSAYKYVEGMEL